MTTVLKPRRRGPLVVEGQFVLHDLDGCPLQEGVTRVLLCRCGSTKRPPFCDGSHHRTSFEAEAQAATEAESFEDDKTPNVSNDPPQGR